MSARVAMAVLWGAPVVQVLACIGLGVFVFYVGRGLGSTRSAAPLVAAVGVLVAMHAGYLLGPWLWAADRRVLAACLMVPVAVLMMAVVLVYGSRVAGDEEHGRGGLMLVGGLVAMLVVYGGPILVMAVSQVTRQG